MNYQERAVTIESLEKLLRALDSDEGIRIDDKLGHIFVNKTSKRYCINLSKDNNDGFIYKYNVDEVMKFLLNHLSQTSKIYAY